jgi:hypothetical protein
MLTPIQPFGWSITLNLQSSMRTTGSWPSAKSKSSWRLEGALPVSWANASGLAHHPQRPPRDRRVLVKGESQ